MGLTAAAYSFAQVESVPFRSSVRIEAEDSRRSRFRPGGTIGRFGRSDAAREIN